MGLKILKPPKINLNPKSSFGRQIGMIIIGTTISLGFTIVAAQLSERHQRAKDRQMMAMTMISSIDIYGQVLDYVYSLVGRSDTVAQWLLSHPVEELERLPEEELSLLVDDALQLYSLTYDNTSYEIFSANIDTWKNLHNFQFFGNVGMCYSLMQSTAEKWNGWGDEIDNIKQQIKNRPDEFPGINIPSKILRNNQIRTIMKAVHNYREWLLYRGQTLRYYNLVNMAIMDISEDDLAEFVSKNNQNYDVGMELPGMDYETPAPNADSLSSMAPFDARLDSLMKN